MIKKLLLLIFITTIIYASNGSRIDDAGNFSSLNFKLKFKKPAGNYSYSLRPGFLKIPGALAEYYDLAKQISFLIAGYKIRRSASYIGKLIRFYLAGIATNIHVIEDNIWLLKRNADVLFQRYSCYIRNILFYITVYIMVHKNDRERKVCLVVASPHALFFKIKKAGYKAYLNLNFTD